MHLSEGVLPLPLLAGCWVVAAAGVVQGLRRLRDERLPLAALLGAAFFVASTVHVPAGVGSVHLILNGVCGLLLGGAALPVLAVALLLQAVLFSFGGLAVLGANLLIMGLPALAVHVLLGPLVRRGGPRAAMTAGVLAGVIGIGGAAVLAAALLLLAGGRQLHDLAGLLVLAHVPVLLADAAIGALLLPGLRRLAPGALDGSPDV